MEILWLKEMRKAVVSSPRFESLKQEHGLYSDDNRLLMCKRRFQNTPSHLMTGGRLLSIPVENEVAEEETSEVSLLARRQRYLLLLLSHFWNRWKRACLVEL